ncbi:acetylglutamate kinase [Virgibacillus natechei]|uniref:Acetylglutamate kinase n=1 Tax=Virgibacillus natechei TaxID=1216297 RepID=A0ABS4IGR3_9BACI|nr:acetylglutamate kinase [Virgibacillus natechei]MBP1970129.1 acetylglutamate kinase [Virgibacillus natechei]UZD14203.1 acetylglutamate kinase [Virgibacillus natechei]
MNCIVLKMGGSILEKLPDSFYEMIVDLKKTGVCEPVIVHGGGPGINRMLHQLKVESPFVDGLRVTTKEVLDVAEMVMSGSINKSIVSNLQKAGGVAYGTSGVDGSLLQATPFDPTGALGYVGEVASVNDDWLKVIMSHGIPVISPIGIDQSGQRYNINGDMAAAAVAQSLKGKLALISDIPGVMETISGKQVIHPVLTKEQIDEKIKTGVIYGGMIPKIKSAMDGLSAGATESVILNGLTPADLKNYIEGKEAGTKIIAEKEANHV